MTTWSSAGQYPKDRKSDESQEDNRDERENNFSARIGLMSFAHKSEPRCVQIIARASLTGQQFPALQVWNFNFHPFSHKALFLQPMNPIRVKELSGGFFWPHKLHPQQAHIIIKHMFIRELPYLPQQLIEQLRRWLRQPLLDR